MIGSAPRWALAVSLTPARAPAVVREPASIAPPLPITAATMPTGWPGASR
ncbi:MAG: hypothetical protein QOG28_560, partial [Trebonia sp.]|nr:hypothetical protein [Trebonia sp.]